MATMVIRHPVADYAKWKQAYDGAEDLRQQHGCTNQRVLREVDDSSTILVLHEFATLSAAQAFASDPGLEAAMKSGGVSAPPRIEFYDSI